MRWTTYNRLMDRLVAADDAADERLVLAARWVLVLSRAALVPLMGNPVSDLVRAGF